MKKCRDIAQTIGHVSQLWIITKFQDSSCCADPICIFFYNLEFLFCGPLHSAVRKSAKMERSMLQSLLTAKSRIRFRCWWGLTFNFKKSRTVMKCEGKSQDYLVCKFSSSKHQVEVWKANLDAHFCFGVFWNVPEACGFIRDNEKATKCCSCSLFALAAWRHESCCECLAASLTSCTGRSTLGYQKKALKEI